MTIVFQIVGASTLRMAGLKAGDAFQDFVGPLGQPSEFVKEDIEAVKGRRYTLCGRRRGERSGVSPGKVDAGARHRGGCD